MAERPDLSVILVNWNALDLTSAALTSIETHTSGIAYETIVVDNGSRDGSARALPARYPWIHVIANAANAGFSRASNQGLRAAAGRYLLLLNTDTVQIENALGESVRYMDQHPEVGALGILHLNADTGRTPQPSYSRFPRPIHDALAALGVDHHSADGLRDGAPAERDVDWLCGSFLLVRRECLRSVGELDERFFVYGEDIDWCRRAWQRGWTVRFWPGVAIIHRGSAAASSIRDKTFMHLRSQLSYLAKHHSWLAATLYYIAMNVRLTAATTRQIVRWLLGHATPREVRERFRRQIRFLLLSPGRTGL